MRFAALLLAFALAGCLSGNGPQGDAAPGPTDSGLFIASDAGLEPVGNLPGVSVEPLDDGVRYVVDFMQFVDPDLLQLVLVQALDSLPFEADHDFTINYQPPIIPSEGREAADFCIFAHSEGLLPGDSYLARGLGQAVPIPEPASGERKYAWSYVGAGAAFLPVDYGFNNAAGLSGHLNASEWLLFGAGESGIPAVDFHTEGNEWTLKLDVHGPSRLILLPTTAFLCGNGFSRFTGAISANGLVYSGGHLDALDRYGSTVSFRDREIVAALDLHADSGVLTFGEEQVPLHELSYVWRNSYVPQAVALDNVQWVGNPSWILTGFSIPHPEEIGLDQGH